VATAAPVEPVALPVVAMLACAAVRAALFAAVLEEPLPDAGDEALVVPPAPRIFTLLEIRMGLATFTVAFDVRAALLLLAESRVEDRLGVAGGDIAAGPVRGAGAVAEPALNCVVSEPLGLPPDVLIQICFNVSGRCQYFGATSNTT
jgi:hypothetical protein